MISQATTFTTTLHWANSHWGVTPSRTPTRIRSKKKWLTTQIPKEVQELFDLGSTIGAYLIFPNNKVDRKHTINQARGILRIIDDRFDLTLECIRRFYISEPSPLEDVL